MRDCAILTDKIVQKIRGWGCRKLSYAGRLVLVKAVLSQLHSYWARIFLIPSLVIKKIEAICRNYLWEGSENHSKAPLVCWDDVCKEKKEGGLGIVSSKDWNTALIAKYTWWIASKSDHLWIKWINQVYLKGQDWKTYSPPIASSWTWRKICSVKEKVKPAYVDNGWLSSNGQYQVASGYKWLRGAQGKVSWYAFVWNRIALPRYSFIGWLVMRGRLLTLDRLRRMGVTTDTVCCVCGDANETLSHLFFECCYGLKCFKLLGEWLQITIPMCNTIKWSLQVRMTPLLKKKFMQADILGLMYKIWLARKIARMELVLSRPSVLIQGLKKEIISHFRFGFSMLPSTDWFTVLCSMS